MEMFFEICRFWASKSVYNESTGRYEIKGVMGPDEFHEHMPNSEEGGLKDNTYTNLMVAWMFGKSQEINNLVGWQKVEQKGFSAKEVEKWNEISTKLNIVINNDGILAQYDGYFELDELDWDYYKKKYGNIYRMDRILKAEGKSPDAFKVAKQADTLMTFYNLNKEEVDAILNKLGYILPDDYLQRNLHYYLARTSHGSTLSRVVHAKLAAMVGDRKMSWDLYQDALGSDFVDIQGGTTGEGIHAGVMAGTILIALNTFAGINFREQKLHFQPNLPDHWKEMSFKLNFKGIAYSFKLGQKNCSILAKKATSVVMGDNEFELLPDEWVKVL
jgi:trehalose/maltose hydrolase-like predicted phosphorylase